MAAGCGERGAERDTGPAPLHEKKARRGVRPVERAVRIEARKEAQRRGRLAQNGEVDRAHQPFAVVGEIADPAAQAGEDIRARGRRGRVEDEAEAAGARAPRGEHGATGPRREDVLRGEQRDGAGARGIAEHEAPARVSRVGRGHGTAAPKQEGVVVESEARRAGEVPGRGSGGVYLFDLPLQHRCAGIEDQRKRGGAPGRKPAR